MEILRTPDERFKDLPDYPFQANYIDVEGIRIHYLDEGENEEELILLMHGEPSWSYLYRNMIPILIKAGFRILAPDLVGFGKSDKPKNKQDHSYANHVRWIEKWLNKLDLQNITLFCQDWGSLIGLRVAVANQDRFKRIVLSNGGLPTGAGRMSEAFLQWQKYSQTSPDFEVGAIIQMGTAHDTPEDILNAYRAPFPDDSFHAGPRVMPSLVPTSPNDPEHIPNTQAREQFKHWTKPFLTCFSDSDPITQGGDRMWQKIVPGAQGVNHTVVEGGGHFVQEDCGPELAEIIIKFIEDTKS
ncbi:MAG: haloalkane dehalogenase [Candidatus Heimdallarchaeota archaeon]|nr:MAG: haloalkane dehalogenase [Candidatus Heimdallarchaeota archaeon]